MSTMFKNKRSIYVWVFTTAFFVGLCPVATLIGRDMVRDDHKLKHFKEAVAKKDILLYADEEPPKRCVVVEYEAVYACGLRKAFDFQNNGAEDEKLFSEYDHTKECLRNSDAEGRCDIVSRRSKTLVPAIIFKGGVLYDEFDELFENNASNLDH